MRESTDRPKAIDAFCGAGGLSLGLERAGFQVVAAFDIDRRAVATYQRNLGQHAFVEDIRNVNLKWLSTVAGVSPNEITLVAGGPPCQGFSVQRRGGESDPRNSLPLEFLRLILEVKPPFFLLENVPGMRTRHGESILRRFVEGAEAEGYVCHQRVLDAVNYGVPQYRSRLFVVGEFSPTGEFWFRYPDPITDEDSPEVTVRAALQDLPPPPDDFTNHPTIPNHRRTRLSPTNLLRLSLIPQGSGWECLPEELRLPCHKPGSARIGHRYVYGRLHWERPAATLTARFDSFTRGKFAHPLENRNLTLREGARLQTFPDTFVFEGSQEEIAAQIGNAIPPRLAEIIGSAILNALRRKSLGYPPVGMEPKRRQLRLWD